MSIESPGPTPDEVEFSDPSAQEHYKDIYEEMKALMAEMAEVDTRVQEIKDDKTELEEAPVPDKDWEERSRQENDRMRNELLDIITKQVEISNKWHALLQEKLAADRG